MLVNIEQVVTQVSTSHVSYRCDEAGACGG